MILGKILSYTIFTYSTLVSIFHIIELYQMAGYTISQFVTPFTNLPTASPHKTIGQVLESTDSSHKPVYVFDGKKYMGVVSAYQSIYHSAHAPHTKKVISDIMHTPTLTPSSSLHDAIRFMMDTRLYELPVVDKNKEIKGVISLSTILKTLLKDEIIMTFLAECIEYRKPVIRKHEGTVDDVFHLLRDKNVSRVILTDKRGKVNGIVTRSDIQIAFLRPIEKQRFRRPTEDSKNTRFSSEEKYREDEPIERFSQKVVFTVPEDTPKRLILQQLIESDYNSVVIVDRLEKPVGFLSVRDIVHCLATLEPNITTPIIFEKPDSSVSNVHVEKAQKKIEQLIRKLSKIQPIEKVEVAVNEQKFSNKKIAEFQTRITISMKGQDVMVSGSSKDYMSSIQNTLSIAEQKFIKNTKHTYHKTQASPV
ncbi:MAG TPA: CBS domain-containing protein [Candidatus Levybacteria bacterium]|nr:CBS domain-containing protein [Candidatus Levybacteria bacterium]